MKILFQYIYGSGGALANLSMLVESISGSHPDCRFVVLCSPESDLTRLKDRPNVEIHRYGEESRRVLWRFRLGWQGMRAAVERHAPDLVWSVNTGSIRRLPCPQILQINNAYQVYPLAAARNHPRGRVAVLVLRILCALTARSSDAVVCQTRTIAGLVSHALGYKGPVEVIGKAVAEALPPEGGGEAQSSGADGKELAHAQASFRFGYVAANYGHKNHRILIEAAALLAQRDADLQLHFTLTRAELLSIGGEAAGHLVDSGTIVAHGWVAPSQLAAFYAGVDGCVMPSMLESLSSAHLEAMYFGKPQIVADLPYARELCEDAALYVNPADARAWADAMAEVACGPGMRQRLVQRGRERFSQLPQTWEDVAEEWYSLLGRIAGRSEAA